MLANNSYWPLKARFMRLSPRFNCWWSYIQFNITSFRIDNDLLTLLTNIISCERAFSRSIWRVLSQAVERVRIYLTYKVKTLVSRLSRQSWCHVVSNDWTHIFTWWKQRETTYSRLMCRVREFEVEILSCWESRNHGYLHFTVRWLSSNIEKFIHQVDWVRAFRVLHSSFSLSASDWSEHASAIAKV